MIGVDASPAMLDLARNLPFGDRVRWINGDAAQAGTPAADLAIMTGHVAQFFLTDEDWSANLAAIHDALGPGGTLAFESRDPLARVGAMEAQRTRSSVDDPRAGRIETWTEVDDASGGIVSYTNHYLFETGADLVSKARLRFRTRTELTHSLAGAGFSVDDVYGDWNRGPVTKTTDELIVVADSPLTERPGGGQRSLRATSNKSRGIVAASRYSGTRARNPSGGIGSSIRSMSRPLRAIALTYCDSGRCTNGSTTPGASSSIAMSSTR